MNTNFHNVLIFLLFFGCTQHFVCAQSENDTVIFNNLGNYNFNFTYAAYTPLIDRLGRPFVYMATKELGLVTFDISNTMSPIPVDTQTVVSLGGLKVTGVAQDNNYLLVSLGEFQGSGQTTGLAIFDITNPPNPVLLDQWDSTAFDKGSSSVIWDGNYAYLSAMAQGVLILDISNKSDIQFVSQIIPDPTFGNQTHEYHARGLYLSGDTLLVAHDNGGLRIIDVTDKQNPVETGKFLSGPISSVADPFYNHVYRVGNHAYCAVDYCGINVVDISNPAVMTESAWLNPWNCTNIPFPFGNWNGSDGHTNEITYSATENVLFFSGGDSEVLAVDPTDPFQPRIMGAWGEPNDSVGTWGVDVYQNLIALAEVKTFGFPFVSNVGGLQLLSWNKTASIEEKEFGINSLKIYPNPSSDYFSIDISPEEISDLTIELRDLTGRLVFNSVIKGSITEILTGNYRNGIYIVSLLKHGNSIGSEKVMIFH